MASTGTTSIELRHSDRFYVDGDWIEASSPSVFEVVNPSNEDTFFTVAEALEADIDSAIGAARRAFDRGPWPRLTHRERADYLRAFAAALRERADEFTVAQTGQTGMTRTVSAQMTPMYASWFDAYADLADSFSFEERRTPTFGGEVGVLVREPVGVVGAVVPWNGPLSLITVKVAPALLAGCTVVLKAAPEAPAEAYLMAEIADRIGLPPGVLNVVTAGRDVSERLVTDSRVDKIAFTGSTAAGRRIASLMGQRIGRVTLELGGKSAAVILDDYDVETAAQILGGAACMGTGQVCSLLTRVIVPRHRHDDFVEAISAVMSAVKVGDAFDPETGMGPLAMARQRDRVEGYIAKGIEDGASLATGGRRPAGLDRGFFIEPTVFGNVDNSSTIAQEEIFGPVISVVAADGESHAVDLANDSIYGLNATVFTNDNDRAYAVARQIRSGTVGHNAFRADFGVSFGGFKQSGIGREGSSAEGLRPYLESKFIILDGEPSTAQLPPA